MNKHQPKITNGEPKEEISTPPKPLDSGVGALSEPERAPHDYLPRERDNRGNRFPGSFSYGIALPHVFRIRHTWLMRAIERIAEKCLADAMDLAHYFDDRLLPTIITAREAERDEWERLAKRNERAEKVNENVEKREELLRSKRDEATQTDREKLEQVEDAVSEARTEASAKTSATFGIDLLEESSATSVLQHKPKPLSVIAGERGLPWTPDDKESQLRRPVAMAATVLIGTLIGISLMILVGALSPDQIIREPQLCLLPALFGTAIAVFGAAALHQAFRWGGQLCFLGNSRFVWGPILLVAVAIGLTVVTIDCIVEREGLLKLADLDAAIASLGYETSRTSSSKEAVYLLAALIVTLPYFVYHAYVGLNSGRYRAVLNRLEAEQWREFEERDKAIRSGPEVKDTLSAIGAYRARQQEGRDLQARIGRKSEPFETQILDLESKRLPVSDDLSSEAKNRIQDALDNAAGATATFDEKYERAKRKIEPEEGLAAKMASKIPRVQFGRKRPSESRDRTA